MSDQDTFERILAALHEAMLDDAGWPATSALIDEACGTVGNALLVSEGPPDDIRTHFVGIYYRGQRSEDREREWLDVYHPLNEGVARFLQLPDSQMVLAPDLYTAEELQTSRAYNEGLRRLSAQQSVMARLDGPAGCTLTWVSGDPVGSGGWTVQQRALLQGLLPHIRQFVCVRQALVSAGALGVSETGLLDNTRVGVIHLDRRGCIVEANDRARAILRQGDTVVDRGGELRARQPADHARLARLVAGALPTSGAPAVSGSMTLRRASVLMPFVVHVKPVGVQRPDFGAPRVAALVLIVEPGSMSRLDPALIAELLGLTPVEGRIAALLAEGRTVREIAGALEYTERSVRWYLYQIYHKQGLAGQVDLVRLVLAVTAFA